MLEEKEKEKNEQKKEKLEIVIPKPKKEIAKQPPVKKTKPKNSKVTVKSLKIQQAIESTRPITSFFAKKIAPTKNEKGDLKNNKNSLKKQNSNESNLNFNEKKRKNSSENSLYNNKKLVLSSEDENDESEEEKNNFQINSKIGVSQSLSKFTYLESGLPKEDSESILSEKKEEKEKENKIEQEKQEKHENFFQIINSKSSECKKPTNDSRKKASEIEYHIGIDCIKCKQFLDKEKIMDGFTNKKFKCILCSAHQSAIMNVFFKSDSVDFHEQVDFLSKVQVKHLISSLPQKDLPSIHHDGNEKLFWNIMYWFGNNLEMGIKKLRN